tara:strand:- start:1023 stop:1979 length:957 start_codon:yes stop_codon:yes gene_type:complete
MYKALSAAVLLGTVSIAPQAIAQQNFISIGTGGQTGTYYVVGQSVCRMINRVEGTDVRCNAPSTGGSVANINGIKSGELDFGVAQSDVAYKAYHGEGDFEQPFEELRSVFSMHGEPLTVVARADAGIDSLEDLVGKRVNIGNPGSGQRQTMEDMMDALGWTPDVFSLASELTTTEQASALSDNNIDAFGVSTGHPSGLIQEATTTIDAKIIPLTGDAIDSLVDSYPYYSKSTIMGGMYTGNPDDVETFGVIATVVTDADTDAEVVYQTVKSIFENMDRFKKLHPAFVNLNPVNMISDGLTAPLHEGAARYYREQGWIQ